MNENIVLEAGPVRLRAIGPGDLESLRLWKNANKQAFFFKGELMPQDQERWFEGYRGRAEDFMFVVEANGERAGCMGFRLQGGEADVYNVIGAPEARGKGVLREAMRLLCSYIVGERCPAVGCVVVKGNPAVGWYEKCGYRLISDGGDHVKMKLGDDFKPVRYEKRNA
jgi:ribosomal protein S18 acetylase RimI-like enzyme